MRISDWSSDVCSSDLSRRLQAKALDLPCDRRFVPSVFRSRKSLFLLAAAKLRRRLRNSEATFILLAAIAGLAAGILTNLQQYAAHAIQRFFYGVTANRLCALPMIHHPWK